MNPFKYHYSRFSELSSELNFDSDSINEWKEIITYQPSLINNLFMAGLGMSALFLRIGAIIQMCRKIQNDKNFDDLYFRNQLYFNLRETLPSDNNWKNIWYLSQEKNSIWETSISITNDKNTVLDHFVTFRNRFVHQYIKVNIDYIDEIVFGYEIFKRMSKLYLLFESGKLIKRKGIFFWIQNNQKDLSLHPFIQRGRYENLPYVFQGLYTMRRQILGTEI